MSINKEQDFGTPASQSSKLVNLEIDGFKVTVPEGTSIMRAELQQQTQSASRRPGQ